MHHCHCQVPKLSCKWKFYIHCIISFNSIFKCTVCHAHALGHCTVCSMQHCIALRMVMIGSLSESGMRLTSGVFRLLFGLHSPVGKNGKKKDQRPSPNSGPILYRGASAMRTFPCFLFILRCEVHTTIWIIWEFVEFIEVVQPQSRKYQPYQSYNKATMQLEAIIVMHVGKIWWRIRTYTVQLYSMVCRR